MDWVGSLEAVSSDQSRRHRQAAVTPQLHAFQCWRAVAWGRGGVGGSPLPLSAGRLPSANIMRKCTNTEMENPAERVCRGQRDGGGAP